MPNAEAAANCSVLGFGDHVARGTEEMAQPGRINLRVISLGWLGQRVCGAAHIAPMRAALPGGRLKLVSVIPSGPNIRDWRNSSRETPAQLAGCIKPQFEVIRATMMEESPYRDGIFSPISPHEEGWHFFSERG